MQLKVPPLIIFGAVSRFFYVVPYAHRLAFKINGRRIVYCIESCYYNYIVNSADLVTILSLIREENDYIYE